MNQFQFNFLLSTLTVVGGFYLYHKYFLSKMKKENTTLFGIVYLIFGLIYILQVFVNKEALEKRPVEYSNNKMMQTLLVIVMLGWFFHFFDSK